MRSLLLPPLQAAFNDRNVDQWREELTESKGRRVELSRKHYATFVITLDYQRLQFGL